MGLSKEYFINKDHIIEMQKLNEEIHFDIRHLEETVRNQNRAVETLEIIELHKAYIDSIKAQRTSVQLLRDLNFILDQYIDEMKKIILDQYIDEMKKIILS